MKHISIIKAALLAVAVLVSPMAANAAGGKVKIESHSWTFKGGFLGINGLIGSFDKKQLQRGFQVFQESCAGCHSLNYVSFRNLEDIGFSEEQIKAIIEEWDYEVEGEPDEEGEVEDRLARLSDRWPNPFPNPKAAAAANGGVAPPDLSLMTKARPRGADYLYAVLTGYQEPTEELIKEYHLEVFDEDTQYLNKAYPGHIIAMPPPLSGEDVDYVDGTPNTLEQHAEDVTAFLMWTAEPKLQERKRVGLKVLIFLLIFTGLAYMAFRRIAPRTKAKYAREGGPWWTD